jgi:hypothetical protein
MPKCGCEVQENTVISNQQNSYKFFLLGTYITEVIREGPVGRVSLNSELDRAPSCIFNMISLGMLTLRVGILTGKDISDIWPFSGGHKLNLIVI